MSAVTLTPVTALSENELRAEVHALRAQMERAHAALDKCLIARRDPHRAAYELAERIELLHMDVITADALANEHQLVHARVAHDLRVSERRRVKLEIALAAMRRVNWLLDLFARIKPTGVGQLRGAP